MKTIKPLGVVALLGLLLLSLSSTAAEPRVSVQLWSVKHELAADFTGTLKKLAELGFDGVEFAGHFGPYADNPEGLRTLLNELGLEASGAHVGADQLGPDNIYKTIAFYKTLGTDFVVVPYDTRAFSDEGIEALIAELNAAAKTLAGYGMRTGYHNHAQEFGDYQNATYWDYLANNTPDNVILQLDVGWTTVAGKDAEAYIRQYPERTLSSHIKAGLPEGAEDKKPLIGQDVIDWRTVITALKEVGGTQWLVLEQEEYPDGLTPLEAVEVSMQGLQEILSDLQATP